MRRFMLCVVFALHWSCAGGIPPVGGTPDSPNDRTPYAGTILIWTEPSGLIPASLVTDGCWFWEDAGVRCVPVTDPDFADIRVHLDLSSCADVARRYAEGARDGTVAQLHPLRPGCVASAPDADPARPIGLLGLASLSGDITLFPACMIRMDSGMLIPDTVRRSVAHEIGHELGLAHVPLSCDDPCIVYASAADGSRICGKAIMNGPPARVDEATPMDLRQFGVRAPHRDPLSE